MAETITPRQMAALWRRMEELYGRRWTESWADDEHAMAFWHSRLSAHRITPEQIAAGFVRLESAGDDWPPSLPRFISLCRQGPRGAMHREYRALPAPADRRSGPDALAALRARLWPAGVLAAQAHYAAARAFRSDPAARARIAEALTLAAAQERGE